MFKFNGQALETARVARNLSTTQLAARVYRTERAIRRYEAGEYEPKGSTLLRLAEVLGVPVSDLYTRTPDDAELVPAGEEVA